jgi:hypothetical protein
VRQQLSFCYFGFAYYQHCTTEKAKSLKYDKKNSLRGLSKFKCVVQVRYDVSIAIEDIRDIVEGFPFII